MSEDGSEQSEKFIGRLVGFDFLRLYSVISVQINIGGIKDDII